MGRCRGFAGCALLTSARVLEATSLIMNFDSLLRRPNGPSIYGILSQSIQEFRKRQSHVDVAAF